MHYSTRKIPDSNVPSTPSLGNQDDDSQHESSHHSLDSSINTHFINLFLNLS